ncbi:MAG: ATP-binding protein [Chitinophagaceae bacterium]|nr:ATP-binding protein [Chitinophagaceae bacterium]
MNEPGNLFTFRVGIVGPESTGKSALASALAARYGCDFVPEMARGYLERLNRPYVEEDLARIAHLQTAAEDQVLAANPAILIADTTLLVVKIWSYYKYGRCDAGIVSAESQRAYHLFLLCDIDLPWEEDPLREHPNERRQLFSIYYRELIRKKENFALVFGKEGERLNRAVRAIEHFRKSI